jgi:hypothetical protein
MLPLKYVAQLSYLNFKFVLKKQAVGIPVLKERDKRHSTDVCPCLQKQSSKRHKKYQYVLLIPVSRVVIPDATCCSSGRSNNYVCAIHGIEIMARCI